MKVVRISAVFGAGYIATGSLFISVIFLAFSFPLQVLFGSPVPAFFPYVFLLLAFCFRGNNRWMKLRDWSEVKHVIGANVLLLCYVIIFFAHAAYNYILFGGRVSELAANIVNFILPISYYVYFKTCFSKRDVVALVIGIIFSSLLISGVSTYHAYIKTSSVSGSMRSTISKNGVALKETTTCGQSEVLRSAYGGSVFLYIERYQSRVAKYLQVRNHGDAGYPCRTMRVDGLRSAGVLESHSVSAFWIGLGAISSLFFFKSGWFKYTIFSFFLICQALFQYYTGVLALLLCVAWWLWVLGEFNAIIRRCFLIVVLLLALTILLYLSGTDYFSGAKVLAGDRLSLFFGKGGVNYFSLFVDRVASYINYVKHHPMVMLVGDGMGVYYPYSFPKGGDFGIVETIARLGIPGCLVTAYFLFCKMRLSFCRRRSLTASNTTDINLYCFCIVLLALMYDLHYGVWFAKSIFPLLFFAIACLCNNKINGINKWKFCDR